MRVLKLGWVGTRTEQSTDMAGFLKEVLGLDERHAGDDFWVFQLPDGSKVEVFGPECEYNAHFSTGPVCGFLVDDVFEAAGELQRAGIPVVSGPTRADDGNAWVHFRAPDGNL